MDRKELITTIENRVQLALVMSIFLPTLLSVFYGSGGVEGVALNKNVLQLMGLVGLYLFGYVFFQLEKRMRVSERLLRILNIFLLIGIPFFIVPV